MVEVHDDEGSSRRGGAWSLCLSPRRAGDETLAALPLGEAWPRRGGLGQHHARGGSRENSAGRCGVVAGQHSCEARLHAGGGAAQHHGGSLRGAAVPAAQMRAHRAATATKMHPPVGWSIASGYTASALPLPRVGGADTSGTVCPCFWQAGPLPAPPRRRLPTKTRFAAVVVTYSFDRRGVHFRGNALRRAGRVGVPPGGGRPAELAPERGPVGSRRAVGRVGCAVWGPGVVARAEVTLRARPAPRGARERSRGVPDVTT